MEYFLFFLWVVLGGTLAFVNFRRKRKREDERMKNVIKQAIEESKKND